MKLTIDLPDEAYHMLLTKQVLPKGLDFECFVMHGEPLSEVLQKIREEIDEKYGDLDICEWHEDYDYEENDISEYHPIGNVKYILDIIDRHIKGNAE